MKVLHIEVGGSYGGTVRMLEMHLRLSEETAIEHHVLLHYPTPHTEALVDRAASVSVLVPQKEAVSTARGFTNRPGTLRSGVAQLNRLAIWRDALTVIQVMGSSSRMKKLRCLIRGGDYDVVHVNNTFTYHPESLLAAVWTRRPVVAHMRNPVEATALNCWLARHLDCLVCENQTFLRAASTLGPRRALHLYPGLELTEPSLEDIRRVRAALAGPDDVLVVGAGRLSEQKGFEHLIRAARGLVDRYPRVRFAVAGEGPLRAQLEGLVASLGLKDRFRLLGFRSDAQVVVGSSDLFVSSSLWEGLPLAVLEALFLGKPVVATDVGGVREVVRPHETGLLVPPGDPQQLAWGIGQLIERPAATQSLGARGRQVAGRYTDVAARAQALDDVLRETAALASKTGRRR